MANVSSAPPNLSKFPRLKRSLSALETTGFGLSGLLLWLGTAPGMNMELGDRSIWVWLPGAIIGILLNLQVKHLGTMWQDMSGGTPNYMTRLLKNHPGLARYAAIGYWLGWVSVPPVNAILLTDVIKENLEPLGISSPDLVLKVGFTVIPFIVAFSGTRALGILHLSFIVPAIGFLVIFCVQGVGWLAIAPNSPGLVPPSWTVQNGEILSFKDWAKWFFVAVYAVYGCETASSFVADSRKPSVTLRALSFAAILLPIVYLGGSWVLMRLATSSDLQGSPFLVLVAAAKPFWGQKAPILVTFLIASGCLLSSATAVSNSPRVLYQMALDGHLAPIFAVVSRQGVLGPSLAFTGLLSIVCLVWGDVTHVVMVTGTGYLVAMIGIHLGLWLRRKSPESLWPRWSLGFGLMELVVLVVGGLAWNWQDLLVGLLLPVAILLINGAISRTQVGLFKPAWWIQRYQAHTRNKFTDLMLIQVCVLIFLVCGATTVGWASRAVLDGLALDNNANLFVVLLLAIAFLGVAIACWTSLPQVMAVAEARKAAEHLFKVAQDAIVVVDEAGVIQRVNPAAKKLLNNSETGSSKKLTNQFLSDYLTGLASPPEYWVKRSEQTLIQGEQVRILEATISDQATQDMQKYVVILRDITERKQAEAQLHAQKYQLEEALSYIQHTQSKLVQNEKMSSLGQLVAGVAHEINNPVNFIYGNLNHASSYIQELLQLIELYQKHLSPLPPQIQDFSEEIDLDFLMADLPKLLISMRVGADRIQKIVASLRNFSRMDEAAIKTVDIHEGLDSTLMILQNRLKAKSDHLSISVVKHYGELPLIECYPGQLNQVFMNILSNAIDALEESFSHCPALLTETQHSIHHRQMTQDAPTITIRTEAIGSDYVAIRIINNGLPIPDSIQKRLFDPFFTTKPVGKGTGLGLSISYDIVTNKHGGQLSCLSTLAEGTEFAIEIPTQQPPCNAD